MPKFNNQSNEDETYLENEKAYQENVSAIEQDLVEVKQKDRLEQAYNQLYTDLNLQKITELTDTEIKKISILQTYAKRFGFVELSELIDNFLRNRISRKRKGREEHVKIASADMVREQNQMLALKNLEDIKRRG